ncbi:MAG: transketolase family protein, partial [Sedimentisphaerales bacterium]
MESKSTRDAYGDALLELGENPNVVVLDADLSVSTQTNKFAGKYPSRFINVGCAEQNLMGVAAGLA